MNRPTGIEWRTHTSAAVMNNEYYKTWKLKCYEGKKSSVFDVSPASFIFVHLSSIVICISVFTVSLFWYLFSWIFFAENAFNIFFIIFLISLSWLIFCRFNYLYQNLIISFWNTHPYIYELNINIIFKMSKFPRVCYIYLQWKVF